MPYTASGELSFTSELELGELGPSRGKPTAYSWSWTNHLWTLLPLALLVPLFFLRRNRNRSVVTVFLPTLVLYFCWVPFARVVGDGIGRLEMMAGMVAVGLGAVCLLAPWIGTGSRGRTWGLALLIAAASEVLTLLCFSAGFLGNFFLQGPALLVPVTGSGIVITSVVLAARSCRERSGSRRFLLKLMLWTAVVAPLAVLVPVMVIEGPAVVLSEGDEIFPAILTLGVACLALAAPFLLLAAASRTHRERFRGALGLPLAS